MKRGRVNRELNEQLLEACHTGTHQEVCALLDDGASENAARHPHGTSALMIACTRSDWKEAELIVEELLARGALCSTLDDHGDTPLHVAAYRSTAKVTEWIASAWPSAVNMINASDDTPICACMFRRDNEAAAVVHVLRKHKARPVNVSTESESILHRAAWHCTPDTVSAVVQCYPHLINCETSDGETPIMHAFYNDEHCHEIVPRLIALGANVKAVTKNKESIVHFAFNGSPGALRLAKQYITPNNQLKDAKLEEFHDYEGRIEEFVREAAPYGFKLDPSEYSSTLNGGHSWYLWMTLRSGPLILDGTRNDIFCALANSNGPQMWLATVRELGVTRHPKTGDTLLHVAARTNKLFAVQLLMQRRLNPFILNSEFKRPIELSTDPGIVARLREYEVFHPERAYMDWLGPYFEHSAVLLLWVIKQSGSGEAQQYRKLLATLVLERLRRKMYV